jgi:hypothetical protein
MLSTDKDARREGGADFLLGEPCGCHREVQVTLAVEEAFCAAVGRGKDGPNGTNVNEAEHQTDLLGIGNLIRYAVKEKTRATPPTSRRDRILAIYPLSVGFGVYLAALWQPDAWGSLEELARASGWRAIVIVFGRNSRLLAASSWPECTACQTG